MGVVQEFKEFAMKGNVVDLAIGVIIGGAFGAIVKSLIDDVITPLLLKPLLDRAEAAIKTVAKENGYSYIFDSSKGGAVLYSPESEDVLPLVKAKLGIK